MTLEVFFLKYGWSRGMVRILYLKKIWLFNNNMKNKYLRKAKEMTFLLLDNLFNVCF